MLAPPFCSKKVPFCPTTHTKTSEKSKRSVGHKKDVEDIGVHGEIQKVVVTSGLSFRPLGEMTRVEGSKVIPGGEETVLYFAKSWRGLL